MTEKLRSPIGPGQAHVVAITAIGGVGKSCLAREVIERISRSCGSKEIIWFSFYEARTEDEGYFFSEDPRRRRRRRVDRDPRGRARGPAAEAAIGRPGRPASSSGLRWARGRPADQRS